MKKLFILTNSCFTLWATSAIGEDGHHHHHPDHSHEERNTGFYGHLDTRTYVTEIYEADESDEEITDIFTHSHMDIGYRFNNHWSVQSSIMLEGDPAGHSHGGGGTRTGNRFFDDHPLFIEQLTVNYDDAYYGGYVGKFNPLLGRNAHDVPGWWGMLTFEEFEIKERSGGGFYLQDDLDDLGHHRIDVSVYKADTSFLQESLLYNRDPLGESDGGPANTDGLSSLSANISGGFSQTGIGYYLGYAHQAADNAGEKDENRYVAGLDYTNKIGDAADILIYADVTDINHLEAEADHDRLYATIGFGVDINQWTIGGGYSHINNSASDPDEGQDGFNTHVSGGYNFSNGFGVDIGYQAQEEEGERQNRIGALLRYHADF